MDNINLKTPENGAVISLATEKQLAFLNMNRENLQGESVDWLHLQKQTEDNSKPLPVRFVWESSRISKLMISEREDFEDAVVIRADKTALVYNLKIATKYYWKVCCYRKESETFGFYTEDIYPRWLYVDGDTNVRDCGGWKTADGRRVKQGMLYRGSEFNSHVTITRHGLKTLREELHIKSVLDLRGDSEVRKDVYKGQYFNIPIKPYAQYLLNNTNKTIFDFLCCEENYPVYIHCWGGADRTGTLVLIINALLGVEDFYLIEDYELTTLSIWGIRSRNTELFKSLMAALDYFEGDNLSKKAENFVLSTGVTTEQIEKLRSILIQ